MILADRLLLLSHDGEVAQHLGKVGLVHVPDFSKQLRLTVPLELLFAESLAWRASSRLRLGLEGEPLFLFGIASIVFVQNVLDRLPGVLL